MAAPATALALVGPPWELPPCIARLPIATRRAAGFVDAADCAEILVTCLTSDRRMLINVAQAAAEQHQDEGVELLAKRPEKRIQLLVITADRGLAGAFNSNVIRTAQIFIQDHSDAEVHLELIGRKGRDFFRKRHSRVTGDYSTLFQKAPRFEDALDIARKVTDRFRKAEIDVRKLGLIETRVGVMRPACE